MNDPPSISNLPRSVRFIAAIYIVTTCVFLFGYLKSLLRLLYKSILSSSSDLFIQQNVFPAWLTFSPRFHTEFGARLDQPRSLNFQSVTLCQRCEEFLKRSRLIRRSSTSIARQMEYFNHYASLAYLQRSADTSCPICRLLWISVERQRRNAKFDVDRKFRISPQPMVDKPLRKESGQLYFPARFAFEIRTDYLKYIATQRREAEENRLSIKVWTPNDVADSLSLELLQGGESVGNKGRLFLDEGE